MIAVLPTSSPRLHHPRRHAAVRTRDYVFAQLIPYIGNKRKLLHLIADAVQLTGCHGGTFVDLFAGSTVVARWAKRSGFRVMTNDWEPYSHAIAHGTVVLNRPPAFRRFGGASCAFDRMNRLPPIDDYVATHLCPADDDDPDPQRERMFFTRANGQRIDAIREQLATWRNCGMIDDDELNYALASLVYAASYASNTSGVFKGFHHGWGGKTGTALYRIRGQLVMQPPVLYDNGQDNIAVRDDAQQLAGRLGRVAGGKPDIAYIDPPYNQHPYGSNYHVLNTITLWDKPPVNQSILVDGKTTNKSAIRTDWRTERRSPYNDRRVALDAFADLVDRLDARYALVSYSSDGNMPLDDMLRVLAGRGELRVLTERYKRYRVSAQRMSAKSHNVEFVAVVDLSARPTPQRVASIVDDIRRRDDE